MSMFIKEDAAQARESPGRIVISTIKILIWQRISAIAISLK